MADRADGQVPPERLDDHVLQHGAFEVLAHAAGPVPARQQQTVEVVEVDVVPPDRGAPRRVREQRPVRLPRRAVRPQHPADGGELAQPRNAAPGVEPLAGDHQLVAGRLCAVGGREDNRVLGEHRPADGHLGRVRVPRGHGDQHSRHGILLQASREECQPTIFGANRTSIRPGRNPAYAPQVIFGCGLYRTVRVCRETSRPVAASLSTRVSVVVKPGAPFDA